MCGIAGIFHPRDFDRAHAEFAASLRRLTHRGPDAHGTFVSPDRRAILGHARLSIIDLSAGNNQPFCTEHTVATFNGEVYNFPELKAMLATRGQPFRTAGDTEVIVRGFEHWGDELFRRLQGMYAIGIFDRRSGALWLARDMFGIKPLYIARQGDEIRFASEIKALGEGTDRAIDENYLLDLLSIGYPLGSSSLFSGIEHVPPGEVWQLTVDAQQRLCVNRQAVKPLHGRRRGSAPTSGEIRDCLGSSVAAHLLADVPVAISLSGGLDSSIITALVAEQGATLQAYTNTFDPEADFEVHYARLLTRELGLPHRLIVSQVLDLESLLAEAMWYLEEPLPNPALLNSFFVGRALGVDGYKVVLVGEGSDELFAGYPWHRLAIEPATRRDPAALFAAYAKQRSSAEAVRPYLTQRARVSLDERRRQQQEIFRNTLAETDGSVLERFLHFDRRFQLAGPQLLRVDRLLMAHGVEARVPFLYDNVLEAACSLPDERKLERGGWWRGLWGWRGVRREKLCLAEAMCDRLPPQIAERKKWGKTGTTNLFKTPALEQLPEVFRRMCTSADYAASRGLLAGWLDFKGLAEAKSRKTRLFACQLLLALEHFAVGRQPQWSEDAYRVVVADAHPASRTRPLSRLARAA
jgi:asparagine synthase (glutamine-hydrolysing)